MFHQTSNALIHRHGSCKIISHILLIFPTHKFTSRHIAFAIFLYSLGIYFIPFCLNIFRHTFIDFIQAVGCIAKHFISCKQLQIPIISKCLFKTHILLLRSASTSLIVIKESGRFREYHIVKQSQVVRCRHPVTVRSLMMEHQTERFVLIQSVNVFYSLIGYDVCHISFLNDMFTVLIEIRIIIITLFFLSGEDTPVIKSFRFGYKMPFTYNTCLVTCIMKKADKCRLIGIESARIISKPVYVAHLSCKNTCTAWTRQGICGITSVHAYSFMRQTVKIRRLHQITAIA